MVVRMRCWPDVEGRPQYRAPFGRRWLIATFERCSLEAEALDVGRTIIVAREGEGAALE